MSPPQFPIVGASCPVDLYENSSWDLKRFTVIRKIADTKFGEVFEGVDTFSQRPVAIKVTPAELQGSRTPAFRPSLLTSRLHSSIPRRASASSA